MREKEEVLEKFRQIRDLKLKERMKEYLCRAPVNCSYNERLRVHGKGMVGFCQNPTVQAATKRGMFVCNEASVAERCRLFRCRNTEESVRLDFDEVMRSPARCGSEYPKLAMLIWFLQESDSGSKVGRLWGLISRMVLSFWRIATFRWW